MSFLDDVLKLAASLYADDYQEYFCPMYEDTVQCLGARPFEPAEEVRNAFDHVALAVSAAKSAEAPGLSAASADELKEQALTNLEQARRHLIRGRYFCAVHQAEWQIERILCDDSINEAAMRGAIEGVQPRANSIEKEFKSIGLPVETRTSVRVVVIRDIEEHKVYLSRVVRIVNRYKTLYEELRDLAAHS